MNFIEGVKERARKDIKTIVLPEASDIRTIKATEIAIKEKYAKIILLGNEENIKNMANENNIDISGAKIINPKTSEKREISNFRHGKSRTDCHEHRHHLLLHRHSIGLPAPQRSAARRPRHLTKKRFAPAYLQLRQNTRNRGTDPTGT